MRLFMATLLHPINTFLKHRWKFKSEYFKSTMRTMNENNKMTWLRVSLCSGNLAGL